MMLPKSVLKSFWKHKKRVKVIASNLYPMEPTNQTYQRKEDRPHLIITVWPIKSQIMTWIYKNKYHPYLEADRVPKVSEQDKEAMIKAIKQVQVLAPMVEAMKEARLKEQGEIDYVKKLAEYNRTSARQNTRTHANRQQSRKETVNKMRHYETMAFHEARKGLGL